MRDARHQGRAHRRRRRRDVRRLRPLPRRQGPPLLGARSPSRRSRPRLLERLYPYLARSPVAQQAMARQFFGRDLDGRATPGFAHEPRWHTHERAASACSPPDMRADRRGATRRRAARGAARRSSRAGRPLAQDQYLEIRTLLVGLPALVAGRPHADGALGRGALPVPRRGRRRARDSLPAAYKLRVLDEKHVLKRRRASRSCRRRSSPARSSRTARPTRSRSSPRTRRPISPTRCSETAIARRGRLRARRGRAALGKCRAQARRRRSSPTPTTWPWSACSRPSSSTSSSLRAVPERLDTLQAHVDVDREHRVEAALS